MKVSFFFVTPKKTTKLLYCKKKSKFKKLCLFRKRDMNFPESKTVTVFTHFLAAIIYQACS